MTFDRKVLTDQTKGWGQALGFQQVGITDTDLSATEVRLEHWLAQGYQGEMDWMARHGSKRTRPAALVSGTVRVISVRMNYLPDEPDPSVILDDPVHLVNSSSAH